jgi:hypothetical protein
MTSRTSALRHLADPRRPTSLGSRLRSRRFELFEHLVSHLRRPLRVLDIGGVTAFWEHRGWAVRPDVQITLVNLVEQERRHENIEAVVGDATDLSSFEDSSFDVAFSNSVIEHLFSPDAQTAMAREVRRVGRAFWVQTPSYWFPIEPHFMVPGWQWLPSSTRVAIIRRRRCGWRGPCPDLHEAERAVREVRLLRRRELGAMFPGATILPERIAGLTKSYVVYDGFPSAGRMEFGSLLKTLSRQTDPAQAEVAG